jgi:hypothetical protein
MINSESGSYPGSVPQSTPTVPLGLTTLANIGAPAKPIGLTATPGNTEILLDWTAESGCYYNIYRATSSSPNSGKYLLCNLSSPVPGTAPSYVDTGLVNGQTYYYIIIASTSSTFLSGTLSPHSDEISAVPNTGGTAFWTISGTVTGYTPGDVTISLSGRPDQTVDGDGGVYTFSGLADGGNYTVTTQNKSGYTVNQLSYTFNGLASNQTGNFTYSLIGGTTYTIEGQLIGLSSAALAAGVNVTLDYDVGGVCQTVTANTSTGIFSFITLAAGTYSITAPVVPGHTIDGGSYYGAITVGPSTSGYTFTYVPDTPAVVGGLPEGEAQNHPNPFDPTGEDTDIVFNLPDVAEITLYLFDMAGRIVLQKTEIKTPAAGEARMTWDGKNQFNQLCAPGLYLIRVLNKDSGELIAKGKILVIRRGK